MCSGSCRACSREFFFELPVNAGLFYPGILDGQTGKRVDALPFDNWYLNNLEDNFKRGEDEKFDFRIEKLKNFSGRDVLIINTLDVTYGHSLYELFNTSFYLKRNELDLVVLIQKNLRWLVPAGVTEIWTVDLPSTKAGQWNLGLAQLIKEAVPKALRIFLCQSFVQADSSDFQIEDYSKISPFPLKEWGLRLDKPTVTFIWRKDRFWRPLLFRAVDNRYSRFFCPSLIRRLRNEVEMRWILKFAHALKRAIPNLDFAVAGMDDRKPQLPSWIKDLRYPLHHDDTAAAQCRRYAESHLIVGCNGSSLMLPGCHAGAVLDIVPGDQWAVAAGSFPFRITSIGDTHFRYALLPAEVTVHRLVSVACSVLRDRSLIELHCSEPWRKHDAGLHPFAWSEFRKSAYAAAEYFSSESGLITTKRLRNQTNRNDHCH